MEKIAVYAGSFCPFTKGHEVIVRKALPLFDKLIIAIGHNPDKAETFSVEQRIQWIQQIYADNPKVEVLAYSGLTVNLCVNKGATHLIRGVRNIQDFTNEQILGDINRRLNPQIDTVLFLSSPETATTSSSLVRELWSLGEDYSPYLSYQLPEYQSK